LSAGGPGRSLLGINRWEGELWYRAEAMDETIEWLALVAEVESWPDSEESESIDEALAGLRKAHERSGYRVAVLIDALESE
jgi:hypothetical protein